MRVRAGLLALSLLAVGCMDASRVNTVCRWSDSAPRALDLSRASDRDHLRVDTKLAGELALRMADVRYRNSPTGARPIVTQCRNALYDTIISRHGVTRADIDRATMARVWWVDIVVVFLPMAVLLVFAMDRVTQRICRAFDADDRTVAAISMAASVPGLALIGVGVTQFWAFGVEAWLLRNGHVSFRAFQIPSVAHAWITFLGAVALCAVVALARFRITPLTGSANRYAARLGRAAMRT